MNLLLNVFSGQQMVSVNKLVNQFWILDLRFWIDCTHKGMQLGDFKFTVFAALATQERKNGFVPRHLRAGHEPQIF